MSESPYHSTPGTLRDFVAECLARTGFYSEMGLNYVAAGDDAGLNHSTRCAVAAMHQAVRVLAMLNESWDLARKEIKSQQLAEGFA